MICFKSKTVLEPTDLIRATGVLCLLVIVVLSGDRSAVAQGIGGFGGFSFIIEDFLDAAPEQAGDGEGQRQGRVILPGFDGVDGLAGDVEPVGQLGLAPSLF